MFSRRLEGEEEEYFIPSYDFKSLKNILKSFAII